MTHKLRSHHFVPFDLLFSPSCSVQDAWQWISPSSPRVVYLCMDPVRLFLRQTLGLSRRKQAAATGLPPAILDPLIDRSLNKYVYKSTTVTKGLNRWPCQCQISHANSTSKRVWLQSSVLELLVHTTSLYDNIERLSCDCGKTEGQKFFLISLKTSNNSRVSITPRIHKI